MLSRNLHPDHYHEVKSVDGRMGYFIPTQQTIRGLGVYIKASGDPQRDRLALEALIRVFTSYQFTHRQRHTLENDVRFYKGVSTIFALVILVMAGSYFLSRAVP